MRKHLFLTLILFFTSMPLLAQKEVRQQVRKGNNLFQKEEFRQAEIEYRKALEGNTDNQEAIFNLANTLYKTERGEEAVKLFQDLLQQIELLPKERGADVAHNAGNIMMATQNYAQAIELYKESLRRRPTDEETRYNLALAQKLLEEQEQDGGGGDNDEEQEEQENEQEDQDKQQDQQQPNEEEQKEQEQKPQEQPSEEEQMSRDNAEQILEAYLENEKKTQEKIEKIKQQQQQGKRSRPKNW